MAQITKACKKCGVTRPLTDFSRNKRFRDGRERRCKVCRSQAFAEWRVENIEKRREYQREWYAKNPGAKQRHDRDYHRRHADTIRARVARWQSENDERYRERQRMWREAHPEHVRNHSLTRRARERDAPGRATVDQIAARVIYFGGKCWMCGAPWEHIDHVKPLSRGGSHWPANLRPACAACNQSKRDEWPFAPALRSAISL